MNINKLLADVLNKEKPKISFAYEKYHDPYAPPENFETLLREHLRKKNKRVRKEEEDGDSIVFDSEELDIMDTMMENEIQEKVEMAMGSADTKFLAPPGGILPINELNNPTKCFNLWVLHTNIPISSQIENIIESTPGIETADVLTKYRLRFSVARAFKFQDVRKDMEKRIRDVYEG